MSETDILKAQVELLREAHTEANQALRSAWEIAERDGRETNWAGHRAQLRASLEASHAAMAALRATLPICPFCHKPTNRCPCEHCGEPDIPGTDKAP